MIGRSGGLTIFSCASDRMEEARWTSWTVNVYLISPSTVYGQATTSVWWRIVQCRSYGIERAHLVPARISCLWGQLYRRIAKGIR